MAALRLVDAAQAPRDYLRQQARDTGAISAGCISKCHGSAGESQAAGGGSRPSDMFPLRPRQPLARNVRPGVVPGSAKGGHCLRAQSPRWRQLTLLVEVW